MVKKSSNVVKNLWLDSFDIMVKRPIILLPFFIIAFLEGLALELICFFPKTPLSIVMGPLVRKFFGEIFMHYPFFISKIPKLFYMTQVVIYVFAGVLLSAISINILKNVRSGLPVVANALVRNSLKRYIAFIAFGGLMIGVMTLMKNGDAFIFGKLARLFIRLMPNIKPQLLMASSGILYFGTNILMHVFLVLTIPIIVIKKKLFFPALLESVVTGFRNFFTILVLLGVPYLLYLPISLLKSFSAEISAKAVPESTVIIIVIGIVAAAFIDCFITISTAQFILNKEKAQ